MGGPMQVVAAPLLEPPRYGLIASMSAVQEANERWINGFEYAPENACANMQAVDPCGSITINTQPNEDLVAHLPVGLIAADECTARGWDTRDYQGRATRLLLAGQEKQLARELLKGTIAQAAGWPNAYLQDDNMVELDSAAAVSVTDGIACLEQAASHCGVGAMGVLHVTAQTLVLMKAAHLVDRVGSLLISPNGNIVVASPGYDGSGPGDPVESGNVWAYFTGLVAIRLSQIIVYPDTMREAIDSQNRVKFNAQRAAAATFDPCCQFGIELSITTCSPMGS